MVTSRSIIQGSAFKIENMVDLKQLQAEIDKMWDNETDDSLINWITNQRVSNFKVLFGEGEFFPIFTGKKCLSANWMERLIVPRTEDPNFENNSDTPPTYSLAA